MSIIGHGELAILSPFSNASVDRFVGALGLPAGSRVLDIGCGKAEWLIRMAEQYDIRATGFDHVEPFISAGRASASARLGGRMDVIELRCESVADRPPPDGAYDLTLCVGATGALGGYARALDWLSTAASPGGLVAVGEVFWEREPPPQVRDLLDPKGGAILDYAGTIGVATARGMIPEYAVTSSQAEWDDYEWRYRSAIEKYARENPADPDVPALLTTSRADLDRYARQCRGLLGFGVFLFRRSLLAPAAR
jgi:SAM-dependent methyltransferase